MWQTWFPLPISKWTGTNKSLVCKGTWVSDLEEQRDSATTFRVQKVWKPQVFVSLGTFSWSTPAPAQQWHIRHQASAQALPWTDGCGNYLTILHRWKGSLWIAIKKTPYAALLKVVMGLGASYHCMKWRIHRDLNSQQLLRLCSSLCLNKSGCSLSNTSSIVPYSSSSEFCPLTAYRRCTNTKSHK